MENAKHDIDAALAACPFCGSEAKLLSVQRSRAKTWYVECSNELCCSKPGYSLRDQNEAITAWNRRSAAHGESKAGEWTDERILKLASLNAIGVFDGEALTTHLANGTNIGHCVLPFARALLSSTPAQAGSAESERNAFDAWSVDYNYAVNSPWAVWQAACKWQRAALSALEQGAQTAPEGFVRYCAHCGSIGEVDKRYRDCCPDGNTATYVREEVAEQAKLGFKQMVSAALSAQGGQKEPEEPLFAPTYYVRHPEDTYSVADPQPVQAERAAPTNHIGGANKVIEECSATQIEHGRNYCPVHWFHSCTCNESSNKSEHGE